MRRNRDPGRIFKSIRADEQDYWEKFVEELLNPENPEYRFEKRKEFDRFPFTVRLNSKTAQYEVVETAKNPATQRKSNPLYPLSEKMSVTKQQSVSYANPKEGYVPPVFGWDRNNRKQLLVGVSFVPADCFFWLMAVYDVGTYARTKDFHTREEADAYLDAKIKNGFYHTSLEALEATGKKYLRNHNELLAGLKWNLNGSAHITVFSNNLESRLLAQLRATDLQKRLEEKYPDQKPIVVPISIYPNFDFYTREMQQADLYEVMKNSELSHYALAIKFIKTGEISFDLNINFLSCFNLLVKKLGEKVTENFFEKNYRAIDLYKLMCMLRNESFGNVVKIIALVLIIIKKCDADQIAEGFSRRGKRNFYHDSTGFYLLMLVLEKEAAINSTENVAKIVEFALKIIEKCSADQVAKGFGNEGSLHGATGFGLLMLALKNAADKNSVENVTKITALALKIIEKCSVDHQIAVGYFRVYVHNWLSSRMSFCWLILAMNHAAGGNSVENVTKITALALKIIEKCTGREIAAELCQELESSTRYHVVMTGFCWLMSALTDAADKNSVENVTKITVPVLKIIEKCSADQIEAVGVMVADSGAGTTGFYWLMVALYNSVFKNSVENVTEITTLALKLVGKCSADQMRIGFPWQVTTGCPVGETGFFWLIRALNHAVLKNVSENVAKITTVLSKIVVKPDFPRWLFCLEKLGASDYKVLNSVSVDNAFDIDKLRMVLFFRICSYMHSNHTDLSGENTSRFDFRTNDTKIKLVNAKNLINNILKCESAEEIKRLIESGQGENNKIDKSRKFLMGKSNYAQSLEDCLSKVEAYQKIFPLQEPTRPLPGALA
ncbi:MAG: hypothetical protein A3E82_06645 [Gammaproteobacteria bacterium RIFCSPHIGHO2_12_FULL_38_11]|nr:MAG: hypothetical protein A3E82_06645 [Gammaproteobacteria bacterium RIFCSPHIGHO2_12_FULL_38_11]